VTYEAGVRILVLRGKRGNTTTEEKKNGAIKRPGDNRDHMAFIILFSNLWGIAFHE
jgi:hypothetical protein